MASALNSLAAITVEDVLQGLFNITLPARQGASYARWISILFGGLSFALVFVVERLGGVLEVTTKNLYSYFGYSVKIGRATKIIPT